jgi:orotate phosphoribosyltransferase
MRQSLPAIIPRIGQKEHGRKLKVEGLYDASGNRLLPKESNVVLIEDVITTGGTTIAAAETLREENLNPSGVMVLVDREEGGREAIEKEGIQVQSIFTQSDLR